MKKISILVACAAIIMFSVSATAQAEDENDLQFAIKGGWTAWNEDTLGRTIENNWVLAGDIKYWLSEHIGFGVDIQWTTKESYSEIAIFGIDRLGDFKMDFTQIPIHLNIYGRMFRGNTIYYFGGGPSVVFVTADTARPIGGYTYSGSDVALGFNAVVGFQFGRYFIEGQYLLATASFPVAHWQPNIDRDFNLMSPSVWFGVRF